MTKKSSILDTEIRKKIIQNFCNSVKLYHCNAEVT